MAQNKFQVPASDPIEREYNAAPKPLGQCRGLREKATGMLHPYNEEMAKRSDLVEAYNGEYYDPTDEEGAVIDVELVNEVTKPRAKKAKAKALAAPEEATTEDAPKAPSMDDFLLDTE